ncbi:MAG: phosphatase PAP2 family protein [Saprospiraceae bacterium]|nr:phosphatase PAP2 family protein [Saprospiraceae bacterium]
MIQQLLQLDQEVFIAINGLNSSLLDHVIPFYRHKLFWVPLYVYIVVSLLRRFPQNGLWILLFITLCIGISDTVSSKWIKNSVQRLRPCNEPALMEKVKLRIRCGGGYSFTSSHATNHGTLAFFLFFLLAKPRKWWGWALLIWALSIGLAQVFVGVHYPSDVLAGWVLGGLIGGIFALLYRIWFTLE